MGEERGNTGGETVTPTETGGKITDGITDQWRSKRIQGPLSAHSKIW